MVSLAIKNLNNKISDKEVRLLGMPTSLFNISFPMAYPFLISPATYPLIQT